MRPLRRIAALGAGRMGRGIAHAFAYAGHPVTLLDLKARPTDAADALEREARAEIEGNLKLLAEHHRHTSTDDTPEAGKLAGDGYVPTRSDGSR